MSEATQPSTVPERRPRSVRWNPARSHDITASVLVIGSLIVVSILALRGSESALGALLSVLSAGCGFLLRGRVESQGLGP